MDYDGLDADQFDALLDDDFNLLVEEDESSSSSYSTASSASSVSSVSSSSSSEPDTTLPLDANPARNAYPTVLVNDDDPGRVTQIDQMVYQIVIQQPLRGPVTVDLGSPYANSEIRYTTTSRNPTNHSPLYIGPLVISRNLLGGNTAIKARIYDKTNSNKMGKIIKITFRIVS